MRKIILLLTFIFTLSACSTLNSMQSVISSPFAKMASEISVAERNALLEALTNHEWYSTNKYGITNKYLFRIDDNGLIVSYTRVDTGQISPESYLRETPRGYKLEFKDLDAFVKFWLTENRELARSIKVGRNPEDIYTMNPHPREEEYDDDIF